MSKWFLDFTFLHKLRFSILTMNNDFWNLDWDCIQIALGVKFYKYWAFQKYSWYISPFTYVFFNFPPQCSVVLSVKLFNILLNLCLHKSCFGTINSGVFDFYFSVVSYYLGTQLIRLPLLLKIENFKNTSILP